MHCPNCRLENVSTTRFCTGCGAVLVENVPGGGRRRVLRPWGLHRKAPQRISPAMQELSAAIAAARRASGRPAHKLGVFLAGGLAVTAVAGTLVYPYAGPHAPAVPRSEARVVIEETALVASTIREAQVSAPPLIQPIAESVSAPKSATVKSRKVAQPALAAVEPPTTAPIEPVPAEPVNERPVVAAPTEVVPAAPPDRLDKLRGALNACGRGTLFERAVCEQRTRIAHCADDWGHTPLCPSGRNEHTQ